MTPKLVGWLVVLGSNTTITARPKLDRRSSYSPKKKTLNVVPLTFHQTVPFYPFSNNVFNPFPNKPWFLSVCSTGLLKTLWEKEKLLLTSDFTFSHSVFYQYGELSAISIRFEIIVCKALSVWKSLKFVVWKKVKSFLL